MPEQQEEVEHPRPIKNQRPVIDNTDLVAQFRDGGGFVVHIRPHMEYDYRKNVQKWTRGMTVTFIPRGGRVEVATAVQHRGDAFTKKIGTKTAIEHFLAGKTIFLPITTGNKKFVASDLKQRFGYFC